jgi:hypothetical protein
MSSPEAFSGKVDTGFPQKMRQNNNFSASVRKRTAPSDHAAGQPATEPAGDSLSEQALRLAKEIERSLVRGSAETLNPQALQALMAAACKVYATQIDAGQDLLPLGPRTSVTPTEVMVTASGLLRAVNLAVFELGMWQSWTGR